MGLGGVVVDSILLHTVPRRLLSLLPDLVTVNFDRISLNGLVYRYTCGTIPERTTLERSTPRRSDSTQIGDGGWKLSRL